MAGNGLTVAHAWLQMYKSHVLLGTESPFSPVGTRVEQIASFQQNAIKLSKCQTQIMGQAMQRNASEKGAKTQSVETGACAEISSLSLHLRVVMDPLVVMRMSLSSVSYTIQGVFQLLAMHMGVDLLCYTLRTIG